MISNQFEILPRLLILSALTSGLAACSGSDGTPAVTLPTNTAPVAADASVSLLPGGSVKDSLVVNDVDGDNVTISIVTDTSNGTLTLDDANTGAYTYTHDGTVNSDSFTFSGFDGLLDSNIATVTVTTVAPDAPASGLLATAGDERVTLNWDVVPSASSYNLYWSNIPGAGINGTKITGVTSPFYHEGISNVGDYYYVVTAANAVGESVASSEVSATPFDILLSSLTFTDTNLEACIQAQAVTYVHDITAMDCSSSGITQLSGIEALTSLTDLILRNNSISDASPLANMPGLTQLSLELNSIGDLSPLAGLANLTHLDLNINGISDVSSLAGLTGLTHLELRANSISDVSPLANLSGLTNLYLDRNSIIDITPLAGLTKLTELFLYNNGIIDVTPLADLTDLNGVLIHVNSIGGQGTGNVDALVTLVSATTVGLHGNIGMSCSELTTLINVLGSPPVDANNTLTTPDVATDGVNCTNP